MVFGRGASGVQKLMNSASDEMDVASQFESLRNTLAPESAGFAGSYAATLAKIKGVYESLAIPDYQGGDGSQLQPLVSKYEEQIELLAAEYNSAAGEHERLSGSRDSLLGLWGKLNPNKKGSFFRRFLKRPMGDGQAGIDEILGMKDSPFPNLSGMSQYFGKDGLFAQWRANVGGQSEAWDSASQAIASSTRYADLVAAR